MPDLHIAELQLDQLALAWPLASRGASAGNLGSWLARMGELIERGGGILAARAEDGLIHGIAVYEPVGRPRAQRVLQVDTLVTFELSRRAPVEHALCQALNRLVRDFPCDCLAIAAKNSGVVRRKAGRPRPA